MYKLIKYKNYKLINKILARLGSHRPKSTFYHSIFQFRFHILHVDSTTLKQNNKTMTLSDTLNHSIAASSLSNGTKQHKVSFEAIIEFTEEVIFRQFFSSKRHNLSSWTVALLGAFYSTIFTKNKSINEKNSFFDSKKKFQKIITFLRPWKLDAHLLLPKNHAHTFFTYYNPIIFIHFYFIAFHANKYYSLFIFVYIYIYNRCTSLTIIVFFN